MQKCTQMGHLKNQVIFAQQLQLPIARGTAPARVVSVHASSAEIKAALLDGRVTSFLKSASFDSVEAAEEAVAAEIDARLREGYTRIPSSNGLLFDGSSLQPTVSTLYWGKALVIAMKY